MHMRIHAQTCLYVLCIYHKQCGVAIGFCHLGPLGGHKICSSLLAVDESLCFKILKIPQNIYFHGSTTKDLIETAALSTRLLSYYNTHILTGVYVLA